VWSWADLEGWPRRTDELLPRGPVAGRREEWRRDRAEHAMRARWIRGGAIALLVLAMGFTTEYRPIDAPRATGQQTFDAVTRFG
jgi:hypothetical protein